MSLERDFSDQTSIFGATIGNTFIYKLYILQNIETQINYKNTELTKNKLYGIYGLCSGN